MATCAKIPFNASRSCLTALAAILVFPAGAHTSRWDGRDDGGRPVASGVYFYRLETVDRRITRKLVVLRE